MGILEIRNVSLTLGGRRILDGLSADFWERNIHALVGPNGAGKSTLASTVMGIEGYRAFDGDILFEGESLKHLPIDERAKLGITMGWQEPARYEGLSVQAYIRAGAKEKTFSSLRSALRQAGLEPDDYLRRAVDKTLSGGERKKVELASILAMQPRLVLFDEPDSGIDVASLENIFEAIRTLKDQGSTVIMITHSLAVLRHADHAFLLCNGRIIDKGGIEKITAYFEGSCLPCPHQNQPTNNEVVENAGN
jgi:Fe-S cluster assembly ATP-binding protein